MAANDDGLGGVVDDFDEKLGDESDVEEFFPEPADDDESGEETVDPYGWAAGDPELREYAEKKGLRDPAAALKSYREAESRMRQTESELAREREMREMAEQEAIRASQQSYQGNGQQPQDPDSTLEQTLVAIENAYENGEINGQQRALANAQATMQYQHAIRDQIRSEVISSVDQQYAPVADRYIATEMRQVNNKMLEQYGKPIGERATRIMSERSLPNSADGIQMAYEIAAGQYYAERRGESMRQRQAETIDGGGRVPMRKGPSAQDIMRERIMNAGRKVDDGL